VGNPALGVGIDSLFKTQVHQSLFISTLIQNLIWKLLESTEQYFPREAKVPSKQRFMQSLIFLRVRKQYRQQSAWWWYERSMKAVLLLLAHDRLLAGAGGHRMN